MHFYKSCRLFSRRISSSVRMLEEGQNVAKNKSTVCVYHGYTVHFLVQPRFPYHSSTFPCCATVKRYKRRAEIAYTYCTSVHSS